MKVPLAPLAATRTEHILQRDLIQLRQVLRLQLLRLRQLVPHGSSPVSLSALAFQSIRHSLAASRSRDRARPCPIWPLRHCEWYEADAALKLSVSMNQARTDCEKLHSCACGLARSAAPVTDDATRVDEAQVYVETLTYRELRMPVRSAARHERVSLDKFATLSLRHRFSKTDLQCESGLGQLCLLLEHPLLHCKPAGILDTVRTCPLVPSSCSRAPALPLRTAR